MKAPCNQPTIRVGSRKNGITGFGPEWRLAEDVRFSRIAGGKGAPGLRLSDSSPQPGFGFPRTARLLTRSDYDRVFQSGRQCRIGAIQLAALKNEGGTSRIGVVLSRKVGKAHDRNRLRRVVREAFRLDILPKVESLDLVVRFAPGAGSMPSCKVRDQFLSAVRKLGAFTTPTPSSSGPNPTSE